MALQFFATCSSESSTPVIYVSNSDGSVRPSSASFDWRSSSSRPGSAAVTLPLSDTKYVYNFMSKFSVAVFNPGQQALNCNLLPLFDSPLVSVAVGKPVSAYLKGDIVNYFSYAYTPQTRNRTLTATFKFSAGWAQQPGIGSIYASFSGIRPTYTSFEYHTTSTMGEAKLQIPASDVPKTNPVLYFGVLSLLGSPIKSAMEITVQ